MKIKMAAICFIDVHLQKQIGAHVQILVEKILQKLLTSMCQKQQIWHQIEEYLGYCLSY